MFELKKKFLATRGNLKTKSNMGKQSKRKNRTKEVEIQCEPCAEACPVCFEPFVPYTESDFHAFDNAIKCENKHFTCMKCVARMIQFNACSSPSCSQMNFRCPTCRDETCLDKMEFLAIAKRSWKRAVEPFQCRHEVSEYMGDHLV